MAKGEKEEYFTLRERLRILNELNGIFNQVPEIVMTEYYWGIIREGLYDLDSYCRKVSMAVLKSNLKTLGTEAVYKGTLTQQEFENHWTTFFDLYDTLESFGSHLTKVILVINNTAAFRLSGKGPRSSTLTFASTLKLNIP
jgi:hypothetical protein